MGNSLSILVSIPSIDEVVDHLLIKLVSFGGTGIFLCWQFRRGA